MAYRNALTQQDLKSVLHYNEETGIFTWIKNRTGGVKAGDIAGTIMSGYLTCFVYGVQYKLHRLAFLYVTGSFPEEYIDHINGDKTDNRWLNLRAATNSQNQHNRPWFSSASGKKNITYVKNRNKYQVSLRINGKNKWIGYYSNIEEAEKAADEARQKYHGEFANA